MGVQQPGGSAGQTHVSPSVWLAPCQACHRHLGMRSAWPGGHAGAAQGGVGLGSNPQPRPDPRGSAGHPKAPQQHRLGSHCCPRQAGMH